VETLEASSNPFISGTSAKEAFNKSIEAISTDNRIHGAIVSIYKSPSIYI
jgi:hypothetical protein